MVTPPQGTNREAVHIDATRPCVIARPFLVHAFVDFASPASQRHRRCIRHTHHAPSPRSSRSHALHTGVRHGLQGSFILGAGEKGKRIALPHSRVMIHQPMGGARGQAEDIRIEAEQILKCAPV